MKYLLDFLSIQASEKVGVPPSGVLTKPTKPSVRVENPGNPPEQGTDKTDETPRIPDSSDRIVVDVPDRARMLEAVSTAILTPGLDPDDWPESWRGDFNAIKASNVKLGYHPGVAAELAYENLKARAACPWRAEVAGWPDERREAWGRRAAHLQDAGTNWRDAECEAYEAEDRHDSLGKNRR